jgi:hypothetical protein
MASLGRIWGATAAECAAPFPCDRYVTDPEAQLFRAVDVGAPAAIAFRWLCQLRAAPYSYDWIDNGGRRSPRTLTAGLDQLAVGQRVMTIFELVEFERDRHLTLLLRRMRSVFGDLAVTYAVHPVDARRCRIVVKIVLRYPRGWAWLAGPTMPGLDLVMMRRQLLNLKALAEASVERAGD